MSQAEDNNPVAATSSSFCTSISGGGSNQQPNLGATQTQEMDMERVPRAFSSRPTIALSVQLIDTYREINRIYYEARNRRNLEAPRNGTYNDGYDDENHDYIVRENELFANRYSLKRRIGKGSFGQVVSAYDNTTHCDVAIKIIKSKRPFFTQAQTEKQLLELVTRSPGSQEANLVELKDHFVYRNHQCLVFEMLSYNLYELLKNTRFLGVSLNLIRKFARQILQSLKFLAQPEIDIIHCDLKPENILLRHPRRSSLKLIDFGSSCLRTRTMYTYIQSRFYRSPEVFLGLKYDQKIDIWSLGCVLVEMHTGEPLFGGLDQVDQFCRIIDVLGMPPISMVESSPSRFVEKFFEKVNVNFVDPETGNEVQLSRTDTLARLPTECDVNAFIHSSDGNSIYFLRRPQRQSQPPSRQLSEIIGVDSGGPHGRRIGEPGHSQDKYLEFLDFVSIMLKYKPTERASAIEAHEHVYLAMRSGPSEGGNTSSPGVSCASTAASEATIEGGEDDANNSSGGGKRKIKENAPRLRSSSAPSVTGNKSTSQSVESPERKATEEEGTVRSPPQRNQSDSAMATESPIAGHDDTSADQSSESSSKTHKLPAASPSISNRKNNSASIVEAIISTPQSPSSPVVKI